MAGFIEITNSDIIDWYHKQFASDFNFLRQRVMKNDVFKKYVDTLISLCMTKLEEIRWAKQIHPDYDKDPKYKASVDNLSLFGLTGAFPIKTRDIDIRYYHTREFFALLNSVGVFSLYPPPGISHKDQTEKNLRQTVYFCYFEKVKQFIIPIYVELHKHDQDVPPKEI